MRVVLTALAFFVCLPAALSRCRSESRLDPPFFRPARDPFTAIVRGPGPSRRNVCARDNAPFQFNVERVEPEPADNNP